MKKEIVFLITLLCMLLAVAVYAALADPDSVNGSTLNDKSDDLCESGAGNAGSF